MGLHVSGHSSASSFCQTNKRLHNMWDATLGWFSNFFLSSDMQLCVWRCVIQGRIGKPLPNLSFLYNIFGWAIFKNLEWYLIQNHWNGNEGNRLPLFRTAESKMSIGGLPQPSLQASLLKVLSDPCNQDFEACTKNVLYRHPESTPMHIKSKK